MEINPASLKAIRELNGLSQAELSRTSGVAQGHISGIEAGQKAAAPKTIRKLADALRVPVAAITSAPSTSEVA